MADTPTVVDGAMPKKAPPKSAPPPAKSTGEGGSSDGSGEAKKKKKAPPPPSGAPPKSAAAALRAKAGPPSSPPPKAVSASVQKIRNAGGADAKGDDDGSTPTTAPPKPKKKPPPPSMGPPPTTAAPEPIESKQAESKQVEETKKPMTTPAGTTSVPPPKPKKKAPAKDVVDVLAAPPPETIVEKAAPKPVMQHIVAQETKAILESMQGKRKTATELIQEDVAFRKQPTQVQAAAAAASAPLEDTPLVAKNVFSSVSSNTTGKAAPQSMTRRKESVEEELTVRQVKKETKPQVEAKVMDDDDDSMDELEEIPILDAQAEAKKGSEEDNDPEIVMEKAPAGDKKVTREDKEESNSAVVLDNNNQAAATALPATKAALTDALYQEMKQLETAGKSEAKTNDGNDNGNDDESGGAASNDNPKESSSSDAADGEGGRKRNKKHKQTQQQAEEKKKAFEFFNPKRVPYVPNQLLDFVVRPLDAGRGHIVRCFIERNRSGQNKISPMYTMLIEVNSSSGRPILYARKKPTSRISSHFIISLNKEDLFLSRSLRSKHFVGKLRSDTRKMEYTLFDGGDNPEDIDSDCEIDEEMRQHIRAQLAVIRYHPMKKEFPRKMEVILPSIVEEPPAEGSGSSSLSYLDWRPVTKDQALESLYSEISEKGGQNVLERDKFICLHKRESQYDPLSSCIVDFRSRATCVSVKNFQLVHSQPTDQDKYRQAYIQAHPSYHYDDESTVSVPQEHIMLQMGRVGQNCFNMDFQYPLSMLQAFAICISRFDCKQR
ncbi:Aste57867_12610 [Aphanomyces stellatus]|uniref:Aste57867_12610 protein n=1 Tax=Aphanomyces stellatus TaxID=120398 RepID=A0A485KY16_9STRA|nr:hypothetical protein As57867_012564 [Aphanomyces stellatus]VFT89460.1 Aste57867_12610 [Aphanomyces stellatus]